MVDNKGKVEKLVDPTLATFVKLDDLMVKLDELLNVTNENKKLLSFILKEQRDEADEGNFVESHGTATTTQFVVVNVEVILDHKVKGYYLKNDGPNDILLSHNLTPDGATVEAATLDRTGINLSVLKSGDIESFNYNRKKIKNIYLLASGGNSDYRLKLIW